MGLDESAQVIGRSKDVDLDLDSIVGNDFTVEWWRDEEMTDAIDFADSQMGFARGDELITSLDVTMTRVDNTCRVRISAASIAALPDSDGDKVLRYFFQGSDSANHVMLIRGTARKI